MAQGEILEVFALDFGHDGLLLALLHSLVPAHWLVLELGGAARVVNDPIGGLLVNCTLVGSHI